MTSFSEQLDAHHDSGCECDFITPHESWTTEEHELFEYCIETGFLVEYDENEYGIELDFEGDIPIKKYSDMRDASYN